MIYKSKWGKIFLWTLKALLIFLTLVFLAISVLIISIYTNHSSIKKVIINELNKSLQTEITVKDIRFTVFKNFPNASFVFDGVVAKDATNSINKGNLIEAESISIEFNIWDIYHKKYSIKDIVIKKARVNLKVDENGKDNFHFWKSDKSNISKKLNFNLRNVVLKDVELNYLNNATHQYYSAELINIRSRFSVTNNVNTLVLKGDIYLNSFQSENVIYFKNNKASITIKALIDENLKLIKFQKGLLNLGKTHFDVSGDVGYSDSNKVVNISVKGKDVEIKQLLDYLPEKLRNSFEKFKSKGIVDLNIELNGLYGGFNLPSVVASFKLIDGEFFHPESKVKMTNIQFEGIFNNGKGGKSVSKNQLKISNISGRIENSYVYGGFDIVDFSNPILNSNINGKINLEDVSKFFGKSIFKTLRGFVDISFSYNGLLKYDKLDTKTIVKSGASGSVVLQNVSLQLINDNRKFENINSNLSFNNNNLQIDYLTGVVNNSDINIKGIFANVIPFLFLDNQLMAIDAKLNSENFVLEDFISVISGEKNTDFKFSPFYNFNLNLNLENFTYQNFKAKQLTGKLIYANNVLRFEKAQMRAIGGEIDGSLTIDGQMPSKFLISCEVNTQSVNAKQLFSVFNNFGQQNLTSENIDGSLNSNIQFAAYFNPLFKIDKKSIWSKVQLKIDNGKLTNYRPLQKLSKYINEDDLKDVSFKTIENQILINDEVIYIPTMEIKSSAINLSLSGKHQFSNQIEYRVNILLSELLSKKRKQRKQQRAKQQEEFGYEEDDGLGRTKIFIKISGTIDNPVFNYDTKSLKEKIFNDLKIEKSNLKSILKEEFKWTKKDSTDILFEQRLKQQEKGKFVIDWDEDNINTNKQIIQKDTIIPSGVKVKWDEE